MYIISVGQAVFSFKHSKTLHPLRSLSYFIFSCPSPLIIPSVFVIRKAFFYSNSFPFSLIMSTNTTNTTDTSSATATCINVTPGPNGYVPEWACNAQWNYGPSFGAAILFTVLFGLTLGAHIYQAILYKKVRLCWVVIMGAAWEFVSFALRSAGAQNQQSTAFAYASQILVLLAPLWLNAFDYMVLGRMIYFFVPEQKIWGIRARKLAVWFVCADMLSFLTQLGGGSLIQNNNDNNVLMIGIHIYMGGIGLQEFFILIFTAFAFRFRTRMLRIERSEQIGQYGEGQLLAVGLENPSRKPHWNFLLYALLGTLALITTRIIYRLCEFSAGIDPNTNPLPYHEWYFYVFDATPMFFALVLMNLAHPGRILVGPDSEFPKGKSRKEKREAKKAKKEEAKAEKAKKRAASKGRRAGGSPEDGEFIV
jgi:RTA1 like protein